MGTRATALLAAAVLGGIAVLTGADVSAHSPAGTPITQPGPLTCETTNYRIQAVQSEWPVPNHPGRRVPKPRR